jgi:LPXTG-motif cell wall-anchored protein
LVAELKIPALGEKSAVSSQTRKGAAADHTEVKTGGSQEFWVLIGFLVLIVVIGVFVGMARKNK